MSDPNLYKQFGSLPSQVRAAFLRLVRELGGSFLSTAKAPSAADFGKGYATIGGKLYYSDGATWAAIADQSGIASNLYLLKAGGTMTGALNMGGYATSGAKSTIAAISGAQSVDGTFQDEYLTSDAGGVTWTLPRTGTVGQRFLVIQGEAGQITFAAGTGATVGFSSGSHTKTARQYACVVVKLVANSDGNSAIWVVAGATA